jgi:hypothetical protein
VPIPRAHIALIVGIVLFSTGLNIWGMYARIRPATLAVLQAQAAKQDAGPARERLLAAQHEGFTRAAAFELLTLAIAYATYRSIRQRAQEPPIT